MKVTLDALHAAGKLSLQPGLSEDAWKRIGQLEVAAEDVALLTGSVSALGVTDEFAKVIDTFKVPAGVVPAGFRPVFRYGADGAAQVDLKRDISYGENGVKRPTRVLYSADSANPYEVAPIKDFVANLTCNPAIIYDSFINNPKANVGGKFKDRYEVMQELCKILGPGVDISVEVDNPFAPEGEIFEEIARFEEILTPYRLVVKVPHTGPLAKEDAPALVDGSFQKGFEDGTVETNFYGHNLAYRLWQKGYRTNFTLMFEPHQIALALQAKPYFINTFIKQRFNVTFALRDLMAQYDATGDIALAEQMRDLMAAEDMLSPAEAAGSLAKVIDKAKWTLTYRNACNEEGADGLDSTRHALRVLRGSNLPDSRLIICSMGGELIYPHIDKMLMEPEFEDMIHRVVVTAPPAYLSRFASASGVLTYQRTFLKAVK
ncbi:MAG: transaldolase family protein [Eubacteriales bacterium]|nr:transaldolase family protein [Eubacteriales bacterium]